MSELIGKNASTRALRSLLMGVGLFSWLILAPTAAWAATTVSGTISVNTTWSDPVYYVTSNVTVSSGVTLTIDPGVVVKFASSTLLTVNGTLSAQGTDGSRIYFTDYRDDTVGGDTNGDGDASSPEAGWWIGIHILNNGSAVLDFVEVRYGGRSASPFLYSNIYKTGAGSLTLTNSVVSHSIYYGVRLSSTAGNHTIENNTIANSHIGVYLTSATGSVTVAGNTIADSGSSGVNLSASAPSLTGNTISGGVYGIYIGSPDAQPVISGNTISGTSTAPLGIGGTVGVNVTWDADETYYVVSNVTVSAGATLTIDPGVVVKFASSTMLTINGTLNAQGTDGDRIYFTDYRDDTVGGDTNGDGDASSPEAGWWIGIHILNNGSAVLDFVEVRYGGRSASPFLYSNIYKTGAGSLTLTNSVVSHSIYYGVRLSSTAGNHTIENNTIANSHVGVYLTSATGSVTVAGNTIADSGSSGVNLSGSASTPSLTGNTISGGVYGIYIASPDAQPAISGNTISGTSIAPLGIGGTVGVNVTWDADETYYVVSNVTVSAGATLTIDPGVVVKFGSSASLTVNGTLSAQGTVGNLIYFTDYRDDTVGGDTNGDGNATSPAAGWWVGIHISNNGSAVLDFVEVRYGGRAASPFYYANISKTGAGSLTLTNSVVSHSIYYGVCLSSTAGNHRIENNNIANYSNNSGHHGVYLTNATGSVTVAGNTISGNGGSGIYLSGSGTDPNIFRNHIHSNAIGIHAVSSANPLIGGSLANGNDIEGNTTFGVRNTTSSVEINARRNWWGHATGPLHADKNPEGQGDAVSDFVDFGNFLKASALNPVPVIGLSPDEYDFGTVNVDESSAAVVFTVTNEGTAALTLGTIALTGPHANEFLIQSDLASGETLAPEESRVFEVLHAPTSGGMKEASISIPHDASGQSPLLVDLTGRAADFDAGDGTEGNPYLISTAEQLNAVRYFPDAHFLVVADIDLATYAGGQGWEPIGSAEAPFTGVFDGGGHAITGMVIDRPGDGGPAGLFGVLDGAILRDLRLLDVSIDAGDYAGALAGQAVNTAIDGVYAAGSVAGNDYVGGLVGMLSQVAVADSFATGSVNGDGHVGGLVGYVDDTSTILVSYATGNVTGTSAVGGLAGTNRGTIESAYATGEVEGGEYAGGLVGHNDAGTILNAYSRGSVAGTASFGGLVGGNAGGTAAASYYNADTSGQTDTGKGEPRTTSEMREGMAYVPGETYLDWFDGDPPWAIGEGFNGGYPHLHALPRFMVDIDITGEGTVQWGGEYPHGATAELILEAGIGHSIGSAAGCGGSLDGDIFTSAQVTEPCTVTVIFAIDTYTVTPSAGDGGIISPSTAQTVSHGSTTTFTITPDTGHSIVSVTGCGGSLSGSTYTTGPITEDCSVDATFSLNTYAVTPLAGEGGSISPSTAQTVSHGDTTSFTITPDTGHEIGSVTGCGGSLSGSTYTTGAIVEECTVTAGFERLTYLVEGRVEGEGGSIQPASQLVTHGETASFTIVVDEGRMVAAVGGCGGSFDPSTGVYTTAPITAPCEVVATIIQLGLALRALETSVIAGSDAALVLEVVDSQGAPMPAPATICVTATHEFGREASLDSSDLLDLTAGAEGEICGSVDGTGRASLNLRATYAGEVFVQVTSDAFGPAAASVHFVAGAPHALVLEAIDETALACGEAEVELRLYDAFGNAVSGGEAEAVEVGVTVEASDGTAAIVDAGLVDADGVGTGTVTGMMPAQGWTRVVVTLDEAGQVDVGWTSEMLDDADAGGVEIVFELGPVDAALSSLTSDGEVVFAGEGSVHLMVVPRDGCGLMLGSGLQVEIEASHGLLSGVVDAGDGSYVASFGTAEGACPDEPAVITAVVEGTALEAEARIVSICGDLDIDSPVWVEGGHMEIEACASLDHYAMVAVMPLNMSGLPLGPGQEVRIVESPPHLISGAVQEEIDPESGATIYVLGVGSNRCDEDEAIDIEVRVGGVPMAIKPQLLFTCPEVEEGGIGFIASPSRLDSDGESRSTVRIEAVDRCGNAAFGREIDLSILGEVEAELSALTVTTFDAIGAADDGTATVEIWSEEAGEVGLVAELEGRRHESAADLVTFVERDAQIDAETSCGCTSTGPGSLMTALLLLLALAAVRRRGQRAR